MTCRVMYAASSDIRKLMTPATSPGSPTRPIGTILSASSTGASWIMSVRMRPGATQLTVMPRPASYTASALVAPMIPALDAL